MGLWDNNLISSWNLDESSGNALDEHGSNDLSDNNTVGSAAGKINTARSFVRANSERFSIASNSDLSVGGDQDFSFSFWFFADSLPEGSLGLISKASSFQTANREYGCYVDGEDGYFVAYVSNGTTTTTKLTSFTPTLSTWYHALFWFDSSDSTVNFQINNGTVYSSAGTAETHDGGFDFHIGSQYGASGCWDGRIDEVRFWKRVLTSDERAEIYNSGSGTPYVDPTPVVILPNNTGITGSAGLGGSIKGVDSSISDGTTGVN